MPLFVVGLVKIAEGRGDIATAAPPAPEFRYWTPRADRRRRLRRRRPMVARGWTEAQKRARTCWPITSSRSTRAGMTTCSGSNSAACRSWIDISLTGFSDLELGDILADRTAGLTDTEDAPQEPANPVSQTGDVWCLESHRLVLRRLHKRRRRRPRAERHQATPDGYRPAYGVNYDGGGNYHIQHEPCWYAVRKGKTAHWGGDRKQATLWQIDKPNKSETGHSTQKPVECMRRPMENNSSPGQTVYEPFSGSGTTIIAGEMTGRAIQAIEIMPAYVDVAVLAGIHGQGGDARRVPRFAALTRSARLSQWTSRRRSAPQRSSGAMARRARETGRRAARCAAWPSRSANRRQKSDLGRRSRGRERALAMASPSPMWSADGSTAIAIVAWAQAVHGHGCRGLTQGPLLAPLRGWIEQTERRLSSASCRPEPRSYGRGQSVSRGVLVGRGRVQFMFIWPI